MDSILLSYYVSNSDRIEIEAMSRCGVEDALLDAYRLSERCWTAIHDDLIFYMAGIVPQPLSPGKGRAWLVASSFVEAYPVTFFRQTKRDFPRFAIGYDALENEVWDQNRNTMRWLGWLGFERRGWRMVDGLKFVRMEWNGCAEL